MDPVTALTTCRSYEAACDLAGADAIERVIRASRWAIMAAPDIYLLVSEWMQVQRIDDAERDLIESRARVMLGLRDLDPDPDEPDGDDKKPQKPAASMGPDLLSVRASTVTKSIEAHVKLATGRLKLHESLQRRIAAVSWRLNELRQGALSVEAARDAVIGYMASSDPRLEVALAMPRVWSAPPKLVLSRTADGLEYLDPTTRRPETEAIERILPALTTELDQLRAARTRALAAGDFGDVVRLGAEIRESTRATTGPTAPPSEQDDEADLARLEADRAAGRI
jgi:hypothetical protein